MRHDFVRQDHASEPCFEVPPRLRVTPERRLTAHAAAAFARGDGGHDFRDNAVSLEAGDAGRVVAVAIGRAVSAAFTLLPGLLDRAPDTLAAALAGAFDRSLRADGVVAFEAAVATPSAACVLLRGILLPTASGADAVLSWKQVLGADATARLRAELVRELAARPSRGACGDAFD